MLEYGEISRQLLLGLWYYLPSTGRDEFIDMYELITHFELAYLVPQSDLPTSETYCEPLLVSTLLAISLLRDLGVVTIIYHLDIT